MNISVFLSYPKPCFGKQKDFIQHVREHLEMRGFGPRTLGVTDYDMDAPLKSIRRLMLESNGLITVAFRRTFIEKGTARFRTDVQELKEASIDGTWLTNSVGAHRAGHGLSARPSYSDFPGARCA